MRQIAFAAEPRAPLGRNSNPPNTLAGFGEGNREEGMERARDGKGMEGEGKEMAERERSNRNWGEFALLA